MDITSAALTILGLAVFESITSIDNAIINAEVMATMQAKARCWFLTGSILIAVFGVGRLLPRQTRMLRPQRPTAARLSSLRSSRAWARRLLPYDGRFQCFVMSGLEFGQFEEPTQGGMLLKCAEGRLGGIFAAASPAGVGLLDGDVTVAKGFSRGACLAVSAFRQVASGGAIAQAEMRRVAEARGCWVPDENDEAPLLKQTPTVLLAAENVFQAHCKSGGSIRNYQTVEMKHVPDPFPLSFSGCGGSA
jgi:hypothetical protein